MTIEPKQPITPICNSPVTDSPALDNLSTLVAHLHLQQDNIKNALAYSYGTHTFDDIVSMIMQGRLMFFPLESSFLIVEVLTYPQTKHLNVFLAGGDLAEIKSQNEFLKNVARHNGCTAVCLSGRKGWGPALKDIGWKHHSETFYTEVYHG